MWNTLKLLIVICTIFTLPHVSIDPFWKPKQGIFMAGSLIFMASCWLNAKANRYIFKSMWLSLFLIYTTILFFANFIWPFVNNIETLTIINDSVSNSIPLVLPSIWWTVLPTLNVLLALLLIYHLVEHTDSVSRWVGVAKVISWTGFGLAIYSIIQFFGCDQIFPKIILYEGHAPVYNMFTFMGNKMLSSNIISAIVPLFMIFRSKKYYMAMLVCLISLCLFRSGSNILFAILGILVVFFLRGKFKITILMILALSVLMIATRNYTNLESLFKTGFHGRTRYVAQVMKKGKDKVISGHGLGAIRRDFAPVNSKIKGQRFHSSHNIIIDIFYEMGLIGVILFIGYILSVVRRIKTIFANKQQSMLIIGFCGAFFTYLMMSMTSFPHRVAPLALLGIIYIAVIEVHLSKRRRIS